MQGSVIVLTIGATLSASLVFNAETVATQSRTSSSGAMQADVEALVRAASDEKETWSKQPPLPVRQVAAVARHGRAVVPLLVALLPDTVNDPADRSTFARGATADRSRWRVQQQVTLALSAIYDETPHCGRVYCDGDDPRRNAGVKQGWVRAIAADQELRALPTTELLARFTREPIFWRQAEIGRVLAESGDRSVVGTIERLLSTDDRHIRGNAAFVLGRLGDPRGFTTIAEILDNRSERSSGQGRPGGNWTVTAQISADRYYAAHLLGDLQDSRGVALLVPLLSDRDVNSIVPWALARIGDPRAIEPLVKNLEQDDPSARVLTILALQTLAVREALPALQPLLQDDRHAKFGEQSTVADAAKRAIRVISNAQ